MARDTSVIERWLEIDGVSIRYVDASPLHPDADTRTLLVIPGHTARIEGFTEMIPILADRHRVLVLDLPGSGESDKPDRRYSLRYYEDVIVAFLDAVDAKRVVPVGGSLGGNLALRLGHRFPDRFERIVAWAPGGAWVPRPAVAAVMRSAFGRWAFWPTVKIQSRYWFSDSFAGKDAALEATFAYYRRVMSPGFVRMYWDMAADQVGRSLFDIAPTIAQTTLLLWGDQDNGAGMRSGVHRLAELLPNNSLQVFRGRGHSLETEIPIELAGHITRFASR